MAWPSEGVVVRDNRHVGAKVGKLIGPASAEVVDFAGGSPHDGGRLKPKNFMRSLQFASVLLLLSLITSTGFAGELIKNSAALVAAVRDGGESAIIEIAPGTFELEAPLEPKAGMTLKGAGWDKTILTHVGAWKPSTQTLPDPEMTTKNMDTRAYLIRLKDKAAGITISDRKSVV